MKIRQVGDELFHTEIDTHNEVNFFFVLCIVTQLCNVNQQNENILD